MSAARARRRAAPAPSPRRALWRAGVLLVLIGTLTFAGVAYWQVTDRPEGNPDTVSVAVPRGTTRTALLDLLEAQHLVPHRTALDWVLKLSGAYGAIQAGVYTVPGRANALELAEVLKPPPSPAGRLTLTLIPGETVWEAADRIAALGLGTRDELLALAADRDFVASLGLPVGPARAPRPDGVAATYLEGFLFPETYYLTPDADLRAAVSRATTEFLTAWARLKTRWQSDYLAITRRYGLAERDLVTLASLVEAEAQDPAEAPRIAGVFYNRLAEKMRLQTDPTLLYRPDRQGRKPTRADRLDATNPFNTYAHDGLPPGPIASPGLRALEAALRPERHRWLYFVAMRDGTGRHAFAATLAEHEANIERYLTP